jgi:hypothetical protein
LFVCFRFGPCRKPAGAKRAPRFYPGDATRVPLPSNRRGKGGVRRVRSSVAAGRVLILLSGRHRGRRVVSLGATASGLVRVAGPYAVNGVPLRRVNQALSGGTGVFFGVLSFFVLREAMFKSGKGGRLRTWSGACLFVCLFVVCLFIIYFTLTHLFCVFFFFYFFLPLLCRYVIATSAEVDVSKVDVSKLDDAFFARSKKAKGAKKSEDGFFDKTKVQWGGRLAKVTTLLECCLSFFFFFFFSLSGDDVKQNRCLKPPRRNCGTTQSFLTLIRTQSCVYFFLVLVSCFVLLHFISSCSLKKKKKKKNGAGQVRDFCRAQGRAGRRRQGDPRRHRQGQDHGQVPQGAVHPHQGPGPAQPQVLSARSGCE